MKVIPKKSRLEVVNAMRPEYNGIRFYGIDDWSTEENLKKAVILLESFDENKNYTNINEVIELYNIYELINGGAYLKEWSEERINHYRKVCDSFMKVLGKFYGKINDDNFIQICNSICIGYIEDFWKLFVKFNTYKKVSGQTFAVYLSDPETTLYILLKQKDLVRYYGKELADLMRVSDQAPRLIISKFLQKHDQECQYYFPIELPAEEYEKILQNYVKSDKVSLNDLQLLANSQNSKECPISDKLRLSAKKAWTSFWEKRPFTGFEVKYGISVEFADAPELKSRKKLENNTFQITYDIKWLLENMDYPTILNNFRYVFEQFDICWRSTLVSVKSHMGIFEKTLGVRGIKDYVKGANFNNMENLSTMQVRGYYEILKNNGVRLEDVFKWFFENYLSQEFGANGFRFNPPSEGTTLVEKCRTIASEMDGVLKQFRMYVQDGEIDRELFEMSSEHIIFSMLVGFVKDKYAYGNNKKIENEQLVLFSDQSLMHYIEKTKDRYTSFFDLLTHENVRFSDFREYQHRNLHWLIENDIVKEDSDGYLRFNIPKVIILKDLYEHDVICLQYYDDELKNTVYEWYRRGDLRLTGSLFSEPEQDYLNYELNKSTFSNGLDLRNKYSHSTYPENEKIQFVDYIILLKIMVLVITKINEEFSLKESLSKTPKDLE